MDQIREFFEGIFGTESWPARWVCGRWTEFHGWMYIISDILIWAAYFTIPFILVRFIRQKKNVPLTGIFLLFGVFILLCGLTHLMDAVIFYWPAYRLSSLLRLLTAIVSWITVFALFKVLPRALKLKTSVEFQAEIDERKKVEKDLQASETKLKTLVESAPEAIAVVESDLTVISGNKKFTELFGEVYQRQEKILITDFIIKRGKRNLAHIIEKSVVNETNVVKNVYAQLAEGKSIELELRISKIELADEVSYMLVIRDIREQIETEKQLQLAKQRAELNVHLKQEFLANMSHEIRTPMNSIIGFSRMILTRSIDDETRELAEIIYESTEDLLVVVNDILDYSKIQSGTLKINAANFLLIEKLNRIKKLFAVKASEKDLDFDLKIAENVPAAMFGDEIRIGQLINNLVSNAIKYTDKGSVQINVQKIVNQEGKSSLFVEVKDTGRGIPKEKLNEVFESYTQIPGRIDRSNTGTGLGLAIVKNIVSLLKGKISVESELKKGTIFKLSIPFEEGNLELANERKLANTAQIINLKGVKVLIAEDNRNNQILVKKICKDWEVDLTVVGNGQEAVDKVKEQDFDLILMDIQMPVMDGEMASKLIIEIPEKKHIPIVALTAHVLEKEVDRLQKIGMKGYLFKPFKPMDLVQIINEFNISKHN